MGKLESIQAGIPFPTEGIPWVEPPPPYRPESWPEDFEPEPDYEEPWRYAPDINTAWLDKLAEQYGISPGTLMALAFAETSLGQNRNTSHKGAQGLFQMLPPTFEAVKQRLDRPEMSLDNDQDAAEAAAEYLRYIMTRYKVPVEDKVPVYHLGIGNYRRGRGSGLEARTHAENVAFGRQRYLDRTGLSSYRTPSQRAADYLRSSPTLEEMSQWPFTR